MEDWNNRKAIVITSVTVVACVVLGFLYIYKSKDKEKESPYVVGVTGGIACGKSSLCKLLNEMGTKENLKTVVIDADKLGHECYAPNSPTLKLVVQAFGDGILTKEGEIDRKALGAIVFGSDIQMKKLNLIMWPKIFELLEKKISLLSNGAEKADLILVEASILIESGWFSSPLFNEIWVASVSDDIAVKRLMLRNSLTESDAKKRLKAQMSIEKKVTYGNVVIDNNQDEKLLQGKVAKEFKLLVERIKEKREHSY